MKKMMNALLILVSLFSFSAVTKAEDYAVALDWNTDDAEKVLSLINEQRLALNKLIKQKEIKDLFIVESEVGGKRLGTLRFVIEADNEKEAIKELSTLPFYKDKLVKVSNIMPLGNKWLDNTPNNKNYGLIFQWKGGINTLEMDRVIAIDLQRVVGLNQSGLVTSSYINTQQASDGSTRPSYNVTIMAKD